VGLQLIKVLLQPTNKAEQFCGQRKGGKFKCEHITKFCDGLHEIFGIQGFNLSSFVIFFNVIDFLIKYVTCAKIYHEAILQAFLKMQMTRNQPKTFQT